MRRRHWIIKLLDKLLYFLTLKGEKPMGKRSNLDEALAKMNKAAKEAAKEVADKVADTNLLQEYENSILNVPVNVDVDIYKTYGDEPEKISTDTNRMHLEEIESFASKLTDDEAAVIAKVMADKYSDVLFTALRDKYEEMMQTMDTMSKLFK